MSTDGIDICSAQAEKHTLLFRTMGQFLWGFPSGKISIYSKEKHLIFYTLIVLIDIL